MGGWAWRCYSRLAYCMERLYCTVQIAPVVKISILEHLVQLISMAPLEELTEPKSASPAVIPREASQQADYAREGPAQNISKFEEYHQSWQTDELPARLKNKKKSRSFC